MPPYCRIRFPSNPLNLEVFRELANSYSSDSHKNWDIKDVFASRQNVVAVAVAFLATFLPYSAVAKVDTLVTHCTYVLSIIQRDEFVLQAEIIF